MTHNAPKTDTDLDKVEERARANWNASADEHNQWDNLGNDEKESLIAIARMGGSKESPGYVGLAAVARMGLAHRTELESIIARVRSATKNWPGAWTGTVADLDRALELLAADRMAEEKAAPAAQAEKEPVALDEDGLPPLPEPTWCDCNPHTSHVYPADEVKTIRRNAVAAAIEPHMVRCDEMREALFACRQQVAELQDQLSALAPAINADTQWHEASDLPSNADDVLVELKPKRKGGKPRFAIAAYFRTEKGVHDAEPGWFDTNSEDVDVVRWKVINPETSKTVPSSSFQQRVRPWMLACFGPKISSDKSERNHRFFEEATELVQACGMSQADAHMLVDYVYARPAGEKTQEVGGVMITLAALCLAQRMNMDQAGETELARIWTKVDAIRTKQATKPKNSPLPIAFAGAGAGYASHIQHVAWLAALEAAAKICDAEDGPHRMVAGYCADLIRALKTAPPAAQATAALHKAIMALPFDDSKANEEYSDRRSAYGAGHLDGRRATAVMVAPVAPIDVASTADA